MSIFKNAVATVTSWSWRTGWGDKSTCRSRCRRGVSTTNSHAYPATGAGVRAYLIDSGIRFSHNEFGGRAVSGIDIIDGGTADDACGHGTGTIAQVIAGGCPSPGQKLLNPGYESRSTGSGCR